MNGVNDQSNGLQTDVQKLSSEKSVILAELEDKPSIETDKDGDLIVERKKKGVIEIGKALNVDLLGNACLANIIFRTSQINETRSGGPANLERCSITSGLYSTQRKEI